MSAADVRLPGPGARHRRAAPASHPRRRGRSAHVTREARSAAQAWRQGVVEAVVALLLVTAGWGGLHQWVLRLYSVPSASMEPGLLIGDRLAVRIAGAHPVSAGDVVVVREPAGWHEDGGTADRSADPSPGWLRVAAWLGLAADPQQRYLVKRVIAVGGQRIVCCDADGRVTVDGRPLVEPYVAADGTAASGPDPSGELRFDVTVPAGTAWLQGDHRAVSFDSRRGGPVPVGLVTGRVVMRVWPWQRVARVGNPFAADGTGRQMRAQ